MLRIMGGEWGGRSIKALDRPNLRPTAGRVKAAIFSIIESIQWKRAGSPDFTSWRCLDLFAGVGGLGLEILSRGASHCVFVEKDKAHSKILQENIHALGADKRSTVLLEPVEKGGWKTLGPFQLILLDPPYAASQLNSLLEEISQDGILAEGGIVLFEHDPKVKFGHIPGLTLHSERKLGPAGLTVFLK